MSTELRGWQRDFAEINAKARFQLSSPSPHPDYDNPQEKPARVVVLKQRQLDFKRGMVVGGILTALGFLALRQGRQRIMQVIFGSDAQSPPRPFF